MNTKKPNQDQNGQTKADSSDKEKEAADQAPKNNNDKKKQAENTASLEQGESD